MSLIILKEQFLNHMRRVNYSERTIRDYGFSLTYFLDWIKEKDIEQLKEIDKQIAGQYQTYLHTGRKTPKGKPLAVGVQYKELSGVKSFFAYLVSIDKMEVNPFDYITFPKLPKRLPRNIPSPIRMKRLLEKVDTSNAVGIRNKAIMEFFYATGVRKSELLRLTIYDIDLDNREAFIVSAKRERERIVPLTKTVCLWLDKYLNESRPMMPKAHETTSLFLSSKGGPLKESSISYAMRGLKKHGISCHTIRHTTATHLLKNGADIRHIQALLGHASLNSTQIYTHLDTKDLRKMVNKAHPRERMADHDR